jgi:hypothetical protein
MKKSEKFLEILALCFLLVYLATIILGSWTVAELLHVAIALLALVPVLVVCILMKNKRESIIEVLAIYSWLVFLSLLIGIFSNIGVGEMSVGPNIYHAIMALLGFAPVSVTCILILAYLRKIKKGRMEILLGVLAIYSLVISLYFILGHFLSVGKTARGLTLLQALSILFMFAPAIAMGILTPIYLRKFRFSSP